MHARPRGRLFAGVVVAVLALSGCTPAAPVTELPDGVWVDVYQTRTDTGNRFLEIAVHNESGADVRITAARFDSDQFVSPAIWAKDGTTVHAGATVDLPVALTEPDCATVAPTASVILDFTLTDGTEGSATVEPVDRLDRLPGIRLEDCLAEAVAATADITLGPLELDGTGTAVTATLPITLTPTGADSTITLFALGSTTLFQFREPASGQIVDSLALATTVSGGDAPSTLIVQPVTNRCDAHAIAEDKRGTFLPFTVSTEQGDGDVYLAASDELRNQLYRFYAESCGLPF